MENTIEKNGLKKQFPEIYTKLFSEYELVLSGHFGFNRFPAWIGHVDSFVSIKQKISAKCYIGIRKTTQPGVKIENILMYDGQKFISYEKDKLEKHYAKSLKLLEKWMNLGEKWYGYQVMIVTESTRGEWLWFTWTIFSVLVAGMGIVSGKYKPSLLDDYEMFQKSTQFHEIKSIAHQCTREAKKNNIWPSFYTTLLETSHTHVYLSETHTISKLDDINYLKEYVKDIPALIGIKETPFTTLPVRRAMIYTWQRANTLMVESQKQFVCTQNADYSDRFHSQDREKIHTHLHDIFEDKSHYDVMIDALDAMSVKLLYIFSHIYKQGPRLEYIEELIHALNTINSMYNNVEWDFDVTADFIHSCVNVWVSPEAFWYSPIYTTKHWGNYIVVFEDDSDLQVLEEVVKNMKTIYPEIHIAHKYDFDNPPFQGIKIEQNIFEKEISTYNKDTYVIIDNLWHQSFCNYGDMKPTETMGLFLDAVKNKIYLNGNALTSKDIKSQTTTIEIFDHILQSAEYTIKNNQLWPSTFSGQQNQMLGKIVYPLTKLVQKETGKEFPLECTGSLREFWLKLWKTDIQVVLIKKI